MTHHPDDAPGWTPTPLSAAEKAWVEQRRRDAEREASVDRPSRSLPGRARKATDRWSEESGWVALGLARATVDLPPQRQAGERTRTGSGPSDPTGATLHAMLETVGREAEAWAHLAGPCPRDGEVDPDTRRIHWCPGTATAVDVADMGGLHVDCEEIVDGLLGTPPSSAAWPEMVDRAAAWHSMQALAVAGLWDEAWRAGREPSELESWVSAMEALSRRMTSLAGRLAVWSGRTERRCRTCGGKRPEDRNECGACRTAGWRERQAG